MFFGEEAAGTVRIFTRKYAGTDVMHHDGRHAWLRLVPQIAMSWDFRKIEPRPLPDRRCRRQAAMAGHPRHRGQARPRPPGWSVAGRER